MAKDPAFLFYPGDWQGGTMGMTFEEKGAYMELLIYQFNRGPFTQKQATSFLRSEEIWAGIKVKFKEKDGFYWNDRLKEEKEKRAAYVDSRKKSRQKADEDSVRIYIVRDNVRGNHKIGSSVNPLRRYNELCNQVAPAIMEDDRENRNISLVWYSCIVPRSEEIKLHEMFESKRVVGEWFSLSNIDLDKIFSSYKGTFAEQRTSPRTENANENDTVLEIGSEKIIEIANEVWKDQYWRDSVCMGLSLTTEELKKWLSLFNSSISNDKIADFDKGKYKKMSRGWISTQQSKGVTVDTGLKKSNSAPLERLTNGN